MTRLAPALQLLAALAFALSPLVSNGFAGFTPDQYPLPQEDPPVQPAGYAFSIWGLIYLWLIAGAGYGLLRRAGDSDWAAMRWWLIASLGIGAFWIEVANASPLWATALIWTMLALALVALLRAGRSDRWWQRSPVALYAGWLTAASSVSVGLVLAGWGWMAQTPAALLALVLALALALAVQRARPDTPEYSAAVIWALVAVVVTNLDPVNPMVLALAGVGALLLAANALRLARK